jgi:hypothetical protein
MATHSMEYDHPAYTVPHLTTADVLATTASSSGRFAAFTTMIPKSAQCTVVTAGTGTGNATITFQKIVASGTAITTFGSVTMSTNAAGYTTNVALTGTLSAGDAFSVLKGADATGVFSVGIEWLIAPGASITS